jgi:hypothetical protein
MRLATMRMRMRRMTRRTHALSCEQRAAPCACAHTCMHMRRVWRARVRVRVHARRRLAAVREQPLRLRSLARAMPHDPVGSGGAVSLSPWSLIINSVWRACVLLARVRRESAAGAGWHHRPV